MNATSQNLPATGKQEPGQDTETARLIISFYAFAGEPDAVSIGDLAEAHLRSGQRVLILAGNRERCELLSERLWGYRVDAFLPHGIAADENARRQPVLLDWQPQRNLNGAGVVIAIGGPLPQGPGIHYVDYLFDGKSTDPTTTGTARESTWTREARQAWYECRVRGVRPRYFSMLGEGPGSAVGSWSRSS